MATCFFIGHRDARDVDEEGLRALAERCAAELGVTRFVVGGYGAFDSLAGRIAVEVAARSPGVRVERLLPYHPGERPAALPPGFDGSVYPSGMEGVPRRYAIVRANRWMVDHSDFLIAFAHRPASNAAALLEYARRRERRGLLRVFLCPRRGES